MLIELVLDSGIEYEVSEPDALGRRVVQIRPQFYSAKGLCEFLAGQVKTQSGRVVDSFRLTVSGSTGRVGRGDQPTPVPAAIDGE